MFSCKNVCQNLRSYASMTVVVGIVIASWWFVSRVTELDAVWAELRDLWIGGLLLGLMFGAVALFASALKLRLCLAAVGERLQFRAALRVLLWSYFGALFGGGAVIGDCTGALIGASIFGRDRAKLLSAVPLNRVIGVVGVIVVSCVGVALAGEREPVFIPVISIDRTAWHLGGKFILGAIACVAVMVLAKFRREFLVAARHLYAGAITIAKDRTLMLKLVMVGVMVQLLQCAVIAASVSAVLEREFNWATGSWALIAVGVAGMAPSFLNVGPREAAAVILLGPLGVSESEAVAASLLAASIGGFWGIVGGGDLLINLRKR